MHIFTQILETLYQISSAGVAITAIALLMYASGFNLRDRISQTFVLILLCVVGIYTGETLANVSNNENIVRSWLQVKWMALAMLPAVYLHFSDVLLTITGRPSRGRRRKVVWLIYLISFVMTLLIPLGITIGDLATLDRPVPYLIRNNLTFIFGLFYILVMLMVSYNMFRTILRSATTTSRRRLLYLLAGATTPAVTSIILLFHGNQTFVSLPSLFWLVSMLGSVLTNVFLIIMAYAVSFFGLRWTDRAIKARLFRWMLRGPFVAGVTLGLTTLVRRFGESYGDPYSPFVPSTMVAAILVLEYAINLVSPKLEMQIFYGTDREDLEVIQSLQDRMLTRKDLNHFLEIIAASICDRLQVPGSFIAVLDNGKVDFIIRTGDKKVLENIPITDEMLAKANENNHDHYTLLEWGDLYLIPLIYEFDSENVRLLGLCGFSKDGKIELDQEGQQAVRLLAERATLALKDRVLQRQVINSLSALQTEVDYIQDLRAATSYDQQDIYLPGEPEISSEMTDWIKAALTHYWGGPKLTNNPLIHLRVVEAASQDHEGNKTNALRAVLKNAIEKIRPEGERRFTNDWLLYNILDLKFIQGKKVREVAHKLSVSEADLYRKQRVALESVARIVVEMETTQDLNTLSK